MSKAPWAEYCSKNVTWRGPNFDDEIYLSTRRRRFDVPDFSVPSESEVIASIKEAHAGIDLCKDWPCAKAFLELILRIVPNDGVKKVLQYVIKIGDGLCPGRK